MSIASAIALFFLADAGAQGAKPIRNVVVYKESGRFGGWPANHGVWSWGSEIVVGFEIGHFKQAEQTHAIDYSRPAEHVLARSLDAGETWTVVRGLLDHPHRSRWTPGGGGLCLHTIVLDPARADRMWVGISTGGVYRTDDGGRTWAARNKGIRAEFLPEKYPEFGQCVHKIVQHPGRPETLFLQNHWGLYRSDDAGDSWQDIARGVPSDFGFPMAIHPRDPETVYIVPLESDVFRCPPGGKLRVYRTQNGGGSCPAAVRNRWYSARVTCVRARRNGETATRCRGFSAALGPPPIQNSPPGSSIQETATPTRS